MTMSSSDASMTLKLLIDSRSEKVLFAEADKDFVDFIFSLLALPLGTIINLISAESMAGALGNVYDSVEKLSEIYLQPNQNKSFLLQPKIASSSSNINVGASDPLILAGVSVEPPPVELSDFTYYSCSNCKYYVTTTHGLKCPGCQSNYPSYHYTLTNSVKYVSEKTVNTPASNSVNSDSNHGEKESSGFVSELVNYMVMDDLEVLPMSPISSLTFLNNFSMNNDALIEEKTISVGLQEGLALLRTALKSTTVLTDVFLKEEKTI